MFEYAKLILAKVSFSPALFSHELRKFVFILNEEENHLLKAWCMERYGDVYKESIKEAFKGLSHNKVTS